MLNRILLGIDQLSKSVGHAFAWCIIILTFGVCYEVFMRYIMNDPTSWAFDLSYILYGALFSMSGAYALSRNSHVRGDVFYRLWPPRWQAGVEMTLYIIFFFPGVTALMIAGYDYAADSWRIHESSINSPIGVPIYQLKALIPAAGGLLWLQGVAQVIRCILCLKTGRWPQQLHDVEEMESAILAQHQNAMKAQAAQGDDK
jgi:TRAP-type mannitol/chloroaromatic compound transport system permease small subunit